MTNTDKSILNYVIDGYDATYHVIHVSFPDDGTKVNIGVANYMPTTQDDLDALVRTFAVSHEAMVEQDPAFIKSVVGQQMTTTRFSQRAAMAMHGKSNEFSLNSEHPEVSNSVAADREYIKQLVKEVMAEQTGA